MKKCILLFVALLLLGSLAYAKDDNPAVSDTITVEKLIPRMAVRDSFLVMGLSAKDPMEGDTMMNLWMQFFEIQSKIPEPVGKNLYGITYFEDDYNPEKMTGYSYFVGIEVKEAVELPEGLLLHEVPACDYAVFEHRGPIETVDNTYNYIYGDWMVNSDCTPAMQDVFEQYDERYVQGSENSITEIWVPVHLPKEKTKQ